MWAVPFSSTQYGLQRCTISWAQLLSLNYKLHFVMTNCVTSEELDSASAWAIQKIAFYVHLFVIILMSLSLMRGSFQGVPIFWPQGLNLLSFFMRGNIPGFSHFFTTIKEWAVCYSEALTPTNVNFFVGKTQIMSTSAEKHMPSLACLWNTQNLC